MGCSIHTCFSGDVYATRSLVNLPSTALATPVASAMWERGSQATCVQSRTAGEGQSLHHERWFERRATLIRRAARHLLPLGEGYSQPLQHPGNRKKRRYPVLTTLSGRGG